VGRPDRPARRLVAALAGLGLLATAAACSGSSDDGADAPAADDGATSDTSDTTVAAEPVTYPGDEWARTDPAEAGFDPAVLEGLAAEAEAAGSNCFLVARGGEVVGEWYWNDTDASSAQEVFSTTKSVTSTLVGLAQEDGVLDIDDPASEYIPEWRGTDSEDVTVRNLISNDSGRSWSFDQDYGTLPGQEDRTAYAVGLGQDQPPGTSWAYNNAAIQTLEAVLRTSTGEDVADYAAENLFAPVGMADTEMTRDAAGHTGTFFGMQSTCEDLARFGHLFLNDGEWDGEQVVPADWVEEAVGAPSQEMNAAYGFLWWLNRRGPVLNPVQATTAEEAGSVPDGQLVPGAPEDMFFALGLGNQVTAVDPGSGTVVVRLGGPAAPPGADAFDTADAARVVTEALVEP
jgi:CubicO group peptidase (beta-lactamase class C family)